MRPRPKDRGEPKDVERPHARKRWLRDRGHGPKTVENDKVTHPDLQTELFRKCLIAATARSPWRTICVPLHRVGSLAGQKMGLQCGHGPKTVENAEIGPRMRSWAGVASPRLRPA